MIGWTTDGRQHRSAQIAREEPRRSGHRLERPHVRCPLGLREGVAVPVLVFAHELIEVLPQLGPLRERAGEQLLGRPSSPVDLQCVERMGHAQALGFAVRPVELWIVDESERAVDIPLFRVGGLAARRAHRAATVELDQDGQPATAHEGVEPPDESPAPTCHAAAQPFDLADPATDHILIEDRRAEGGIRCFP
jgi:hypothetical protein